MNRGPIGRRYWSSLTGVGYSPTPQRNWRGQPFWRRYVASFFVLPQPPGHGQASAETAKAPRTSSVSQQQRVRAPRLFRFQAAILAGAAVLVVGFSVTQLGNGSSNDSAGPKPTSIGGGDVTSPPTYANGSGPLAGSGSGAPPPTPSAIPTKVEPWQGTVRVTTTGEEDTAGPARPAGLRFGLQVSGTQALVGAGNLAQWTEQGTAPTAAACVALLKGGAVYQVTVQVGDQICIAALNGRTASAKVADEGTGGDGTPYIDLDVMVYVP